MTARPATAIQRDLLRTEPVSTDAPECFAHGRSFTACLRQCSMCVDKLEQAAQQKIGKPSATAVTPDDYPDMPESLRRRPKGKAA